jgi:hypothetical protein
VRAACEALSPDRVAKWRAGFERVRDEARRAAKEAGREGKATTRPMSGMKLNAPELWSWVAARERSMREQLEGKRTGFVAGFRDPELLPGGMAKSAPAAVAAMRVADADGDGVITEKEIVEGTRRLMEAAGAPPAGPVDRAGMSKAVEKLLTAEMRKVASAEAWANWVMRVADASGDGKVTGEEIMIAFRRHLAGSDRDHDGVMGGREIVDAFGGTGVP